MSGSSPSASVPIGIHFGTTHCSVGIFGSVFSDLGRVPSCVGLVEGGGVVVGDEAKKNLVEMKPGSTIIAGVPQLIGPEVDQFSQDFYWNNHLVWNSNMLVIPYKGKSRAFYPEQICSMLLAKLKEVAEGRLRVPVTDVVVTVPASFSYSHRQAVEDAARIAGLNPLRLITAPVAAALAHYCNRKIEGKRNALVFKYGGYNLDLAVVTIENGWVVVKACTGCWGVGGDYLDEQLAKALAEEFQRKRGRGLQANEHRRLRSACEEAKKKLSLPNGCDVQVGVSGLGGGGDSRICVTRARFEELCAEVFKSDLQSELKKVLKMAELEKADVQEVILAGGSSYIPKIKMLVQGFFDEKTKCHYSVLKGTEAVEGAAIQAALLTIDDKDEEVTRLVDVLPFSLGVQTIGGFMKTLIYENSAFPMMRMETIKMESLTFTDYQSDLDITILENMSTKVVWNDKIGIVKLKDMLRAPRHFHQIEVAFELDVNGILSVSAVEQLTRKKSCVKIVTSNYRLGSDNLDVLKADAEEFQSDEKNRIERTVAQEKLAALCSEVESVIKADRETEERRGELRKTLTSKYEDMTKWLNENQYAGMEEIEVKQRELKLACQPLIENLFRPRAQPSEEIRRQFLCNTTGPSEVRCISGDQPPEKRARPST